MIEFFFALMPIVILVILMVFLEMPALKSMPVAWAAAAFTGIFIWKMSLPLVGASFIKGSLVALDIALIVFGAIFLLEATKNLGFLSSIDAMLQQISPDRRVHAIIIAWGFGTFIEGAAGFGAPVAINAPLLAGLGIPAFSAIIAVLIANSTPVSFGAIGTPITLGIGSGIHPSPSAEVLQAITVQVAIIHSIIGLFIPLMIVCALTKLGPEKSFKKGLELWKFSMLCGACFVIPYLLIAIYFGPLFPSLLGGLIGFVLMIFFAKKKIFLPKNEMSTQEKNIALELKHSPLTALSPYLVVAVVLLITRIPFVSEDLRKLSFKATGILSTQVSHTFTPLMSPGIIMFLVGLGTVLYFHEDKKQTIKTLASVSLKSIYVFIAIAFAVGMVQIFMLSETNSSGFPSIPVYFAQLIASITGKAFVLLSPIVGAFGAFLSGSNTVSNLLMASVQNEVAIKIGVPVILMLSLQVVGGAIGNMIAIHSILAASATVNLKHQEGKVIAFNIIPVLIYCLAAGIIGIIIYLIGL